MRLESPAWLPTTPPARLRPVSAPAGEPGDNPRLLLLDGHSLAYRAWFALPPENFSTATGQTTNAVYGFTSMLINMIRDEQPTHIAVAFDVGRKTFRAEAYADYKANRQKTPDEFRSQLSLIKDVLEALRIPFFEVEGYEADDVIATLGVRRCRPRLRRPRGAPATATRSNWSPTISP